MLILLRLAEDVIFFQTLPAQRRRDIQQKLTQNMDSIFSFMMTILRMNVEELRKLVSEHSFCIPTMPLNFFWETWSVFNNFFLIFPRKWYLVRNSRWEVYICLSPLNSAASSFTAFMLLPSFIFGPPGQSFLSSCCFYAEHTCRVYRLGVAYLHQL